MSNIYSVENGKIKFQLHPAQREVVNLLIKEELSEDYKRKPRQILMSAGTGGGKTAFGIILVYLYWRKLKRERGKYPAKFIITAPTYKLLHGIVIDDLVRFFGMFKAGKMKGGTSDPKYELNDGSVIHFRNSRDAHSIEGIHADFIWSDEIGYDTRNYSVPEESYNVMLDRVRAKKGVLFMTTTPYKYNWVARRIVSKARVLNFDVDIDRAIEYYKEYEKIDTEDWEKKGILVRKWEKTEGDDNILVIKFPSILNPTYDFDGFVKSKNDWDEANYKMRFWGDWFMSESRVLYQFTEDQHVVPPFKVPKGWESYLGIDYGQRDPFAANWIVRDPETGKWYVVFEYLEIRKDNVKHAKEIARITRLLKKKIDLPDIQKIYTDPSGGYRAEQTRQNMVDFAKAIHAQGIDVQPSQAYNAISGGVAVLNSLLEKGMLYIVSHCGETIKQALEWEELGDPHGKEHNWDAIRYVIATEEKINNRYHYGAEEDKKDDEDKEPKPIGLLEAIKLENLRYKRQRRRSDGFYIG